MEKSDTTERTHILRRQTPFPAVQAFPLKRAERVFRVLQEVGLALNRAKPILVALHTLLSILFLLYAADTASAQGRGRTAASTSTGKTATKVTGSGGRALMPAKMHTFMGPKTAALPANLTLRKPSARLLAHLQGRAPGDQAVVRQTILLTKLDPSIQYSYTTAPDDSEHPFWTSDEKYVFFDSNRNSDQDPTTSTSGRFNLFSMFADGSGLSQVRVAGENEIEPAVSVDGTTVAYVGGGQLSVPHGDLDTLSSSGFQLFTYSISAAGTPTNLTTNNPSGFNFTDVRHPTWAPGGTQIAFAGQLGAGKPYHIFIVDTQTDNITQLTGPAPGTVAAFESNDYGPAWSPDGNVIAFSTNASGFTSPSPMAATGLNPQNQTTPGDRYQYDIWVVAPNAFAPDPHQVTNSSSIVGNTQTSIAIASSNKNPAWSTLKTDPLGNIPNETNASGYVTSSANLLAFASTRANADPNNPLQATAVKPTYDIYFMHAHVAGDPNNPGLYTVVTPEAPGNAAIKLQTTSPGKTYDPNYPNDPAYNDPTFNFDPNFTSNEDNPAWPQYVSSYRIAFQSDRGGSLQLWASTIIDLNAPTLLKYDLTNNEIVHVALDSAPNTSIRQASAGQAVRFRVRAVDYESGIESVWLQIKDPNSSAQSSDGQEHKVYYMGLGLLSATQQVINPPYEIDSQAIQPSTYQFRTPGSVPPNYVNKVGEQQGGHPSMPGTWPGWNQYMPGIDDATAFSGGVAPPDSDDPGNDYSNQGGFWLRLWDDGPITQGGHEPVGEVAGDGVYTASWVTPASLPSDWILDVIVRDNAINPFNYLDPTDPNSRTNWKIYDNVWGFTTQPFNGTSGILYVNDYDCGQKFLQTNAGAFTNSGIFSRIGADAGSFNSTEPGAPGTFFMGVQTESWMTEFEPSMIPNSALNGATVVALVNYLSTLGINAYQDALTQQPGSANSIPVTAAYDQWRVICRGPVPDAVLNAYKGHVETQPADVLAGGTGPRQVFVSERCVFWHSPYSGDLFVGPGTILDSDTQVRLANFVTTGGRLFLNGNDLAWGLTLGGGSTNPLLNSTFQVNFATDAGGVTIKAHNTDPPVVAPYTAPLSNMGRGDHPIIDETWYGSYHAYPGTVTPDDPPGASNFYLGSIPGTTREYEAPGGPVSADGVTFLAPSVLDTSDYDATYNETGTQNMVWITTTAAPIVSKVVLISFGLEAVNPESFAEGTAIALKNRRAEIVHNIGDYLRTGRLYGIVQDLNGGAPLKNVFLRAVSQHRKNADGSGYVYSTTYTLADGSYVLDGLDTTGSYTIDAFKAGYITSHQQAGIFHGGFSDKEDFFLAQAQPGSISGKVTAQTTNQPAPGLIVIATDVVTAATFSATTQADGTYNIVNVPASKYNVAIPKAPAGNLDTLGYGSAVGQWTGQPVVTVTSNTASTGNNFIVTPVPGTIAGIVTAHSPNGNPNNIIIGATVTAVNTASNVSTTAQTNSSGQYTIANLTPGNYNVSCIASGYKPSVTIQTTVTSKQTATVNFVDSASGQDALVTAQPGGVSGLVTTSLGIPISGATITITDTTGKVLTTTTTGAVQTSGNYQFNYDTGMVVPAGAVVSVAASDPGYTATTPPANPQQVTITEATETTGINFFLDPLHVFNHPLSLVSSPYDYSGIAGNSVAQLLGVPSGDVTDGAFAFLTWSPTGNTYVNYPTAPANTFHLGDGYFMQETNLNVNLSLTTIGTPATPNTVFQLHMKPGWNLIGDPFSFPINFLNLKVQAADGTQQDILTAQTGANPTLGAALWGYSAGVYEVSFTLDPWVGYWLQVFDNRPAGQQTTPADIILLVDPAQQQNRSAAQPANPFKGNATSLGGWQLTLNATAGTVNAAPAIMGVARGAVDTYDRFKLAMPPAVGKSTVTMTSDHSDWAQHNGQYSIDVRSASTTAKTWNFTVTSTVPNQPVTITWPAIATVSGKEDFILTDTETNTTVDLRTASNYTIPGGKTGVSRKLTIAATPATLINLQVENINAHLNAGGGTKGASVTSMSINFTLTGNATTQVSILKNGQVVRHIEQGHSRAAGSADLVWDLKNDKGIALPADAYTLEVRAQDAQGHTVRQIAPIVLVR